MIPRVLAALRGSPWHLHGGPAALDALALAASRPAPRLLARRHARGDGAYENVAGVAVVSVSGVLVNFDLGDELMDWIGLYPYARLAAALRAAGSDPGVVAVVIDCDSPGGMHWGVEDAGQAVLRCAAAKPVVAHTATLCCSAMYWVAAQCHAVYAHGQALVGSIGTVVTTYDLSRAYERAGVEPVAIASHEHKAALTEGLPVRDDDTADLRDLVSECAGAFVRAVARGRGMDERDVLALATGRVWTARHAAANGLTDGVLDLPGLLARLGAGRLEKGRDHGRA